MSEGASAPEQAEAIHMTDRVARPSLRRLLPAAIPFVIVTGLMVLFLERVGVEAMRGWIDEAGPLAPLLYILIKVVTYVFAPLSSGPIQLSAGLLFDVLPGTIYTVIGEVVGGTISFLMARHLGRPIVRRFVGVEGMQRVDEFVKQLGGWRALAYARIFLFGIYDFISYAAGFSATVTLRQYVLVSVILGTVPSFVFVYAGASLTGDRRLLLAIWALVALASVLPWLVSRYLRQRRAQEGA